MTVNDVVNGFKARLRGAYPAEEVDAMTRVVMEEVLHYTPVDVVIRGDFDVPEFMADQIQAVATRLLRHEPLQYILGVARFHGHNFKVTPATLIPRPETEQLVDMVVDELGSRADLRVLDVGTGSGCIAIALARALRFAHVTAIDISNDALAVARENANALGVKVDFEQADIFTMPAPPRPTLDVLVSNPPYVMESERATIEANVLNYEPAGALFVPDDDPLRYYVAIARYAMGALVPGGRLYLEINQQMGNAMRKLLNASGFDQVEIRRDHYGNDRFATATRP